ncbi:phosphatidate cytidylyltransferase [Tanticharoenia sakaeratensis NBRC 103193]|uniref:Phosphatidate cytidylyltransferase n=1 Tax=Tanticharoenia sakaeratensis NBRC 103193 TaxID=1231623 RepID=A0A0D6MLJ8_9PROT|nr:phosphatidate cytidylyltransferase [Tanticharoenia sakaeratensis]GAN54270.1 phosphatidate cytidylyltransferase [Tanticharoenia sakaeratensis NBRC 103193]GBQ19096.1 phosphatidate cytidylyltransferase [Tanticharoenia sakaeratensis NBRC 103193]
MAGRGGGWRDLRLRLISAAVLVPLALFCIWAGGVVYDALIVLVMAGMAFEGAALLGLPWRSWRGILFVVWPAVAAVAALRSEWRAAFSVVGAGLLFGGPLWIVQIVAGIGGLSLLWLRGLPHGALQVLFVIVVVMASDTCAYVAGRLFGGPKLAPSISPGKTWSGSGGGFVGAVLLGALVASAWADPVGGAVTGGLLGIFAQCGDLTESAAKRRLGVKDSGALIPGHGGLLDRFDGLLAAAPLAALLSLAAGTRPFWSVPLRAVGIMP